MTRRNLIHKWSVYGLGLVLVWLLDGCILPRYPLFGTIPMLLPLAATAVAVLEGAYGGAGFGMAVGLVWELADVCNGLMAIPNLTALFLLSRQVFAEQRDYEKRYKSRYRRRHKRRSAPKQDSFKTESF